MKYDELKSHEEVEKVSGGNLDRMQECRCRTSYGGCLMVDAHLGWRHGMPLEDCDVCWKLGGEKSPEAIQFRAEYAAAIVGINTARALETDRKPPREVLVQLTVRHQTIPEERFKAPDIQSALRASVGWVKTQPLWKKAHSLVAAFWSKWTTEIDPEKRNARQVSCFGSTMQGEQVAQPCQMLRHDPKGGFFCGACGCGAKPAAILGSTEKKGIGEPSKLDFPELPCPLEKAGFSNERLL